MSTDAVWRDPMDYDPMRDGPPYLPVTAVQRREAREYVNKSAAYYDVPKPKSPYDALSQLLVGLRLLAMVHQTAHWQTRGHAYYGDHLLFERLYNDSQEGIDGLAERLVGLTGDPSKVCLCDQVHSMHTILETWKQRFGHKGAPEPNALVALSLNAETMLIKALTTIKKHIEASGALTEGLDDLLQGIASKHEEFVYLLTQRSRQVVYSYDRS